MDTFWGLTATGWTAIYTVVTAGLFITAIIAAFYAKQQWQASLLAGAEQRKAEREASRPYVVVTVASSLAHPQLFDLVVSNIGRRPAERVSITLDPDPVRADEIPGSEIAYAKMLTEPVAMIAPAQELRVFFDSYIERKGRTDLPAEHTVSLSYEDSSGHRYSSTSTLDLDAMRGSTYLAVNTGRIHLVVATPTCSRCAG
jgi:hypothetical protein